MYVVDYDKVPERLIPGLLRKTKMLAWLKVCLTGVKNLYNDFLTFRTEKLKDVSYNSQTIMMVKFLNDQYPDALGNIYIENISSTAQTWVLYTEAEQVPYVLYSQAEGLSQPLITFNELIPFDFFVWVPTTLNFDPDEMRVRVDKYKLASKRFQIKTY